jgi:hypothetical protein
MCSSLAGDSGFSHQGWTLDNCDITSLYMNTDAGTFIMDYTALINCKADAWQMLGGNTFEITACADRSESLLAGKYGSLLGVQMALENPQAADHSKLSDARGSVLNSLTTVSSSEFATCMLLLSLLSNKTTPQIISFQANFPWCPASLGSDAPCATQVPPINITSMFEYTEVGSVLGV